MKRFRNILVLAEGSEKDEAAIRRAAALARRNEGRLTLMGVCEPPRASLASILGTARTEEVTRDAENALEEELRGLWKMFGVPEVEPEFLIKTGTTFLQVIYDVLRNERDLVISTAEENQGVRGLFFGSVNMHLMRKCPCPVWVIRKKATRPYRRVLAAVDPDPMRKADESRNKINRKILEIASSLADREGSELHIIHCWELFGEATLRSGRVRFPEQEISRWAGGVQGEHRRALNELMDQAGVKPDQTTIHFLRGDEGALIPETAERELINLIVMGTVSRSGLSGLLIGNSAERVLQQVKCSVLTCKPDDFETPVRLED